MKPIHWIALSACALILIGILVLSFSGGPATPETLAARSLQGGDAKARAHAASELSMRQGHKIPPLLRKLQAESKDPEVVVIAINSLSDRHDMENLLLFYDGLGNADKSVRKASLKAVLKIWGGTIPGGLTYDVEDSPEKCAEIGRKLAEIRAADLAKSAYKD